MQKIGEANISVNIDLKALTDDISKAVSSLDDAIGKMRKSLDIKPSGDGLEKTKKSIHDIGDESKKSAKEVDELGRHGEKSIDKLLKFSAVQGAVQGLKTAFTEMKGLVLDTVNSFADAELTTEKLRAGLTNLGDVDSLDRLLNQAKELQGITPFNDDDITNMQGLLTTFQLNGDAIEKLTPSMLNLSSAFARAGDTGMNLQQIAILFGKAVGADFTDALTRVGIIMTDTQKRMLDMTTGMDRVNVFLDVMKQNASITAEAFGQTLAGKLMMAKNSIDEVKEALGEAFAPIVLTVIEAMKKFTEIFTNLPPIVQGAIGVVTLLSIAVIELIAVMVIFDVTTGGLLLLLGAIVGAFAGVIIVIGANIDAIKEFINENDALRNAFENAKEIVDFFIEGLEDLWNFLVDELSSAFEQITDMINETASQMDVTGSSSDDLLGTIKALITNGFEILKDVIAVVIDLYIRIYEVVSNFIVRNQDLVNSLIFVGSAGFQYVSLMVQGTIGYFLTMIDVAGRVAQALSGIVTIVRSFSGLNMINLITNPEGVIRDMEAGMKQVSDAFKSEVNQTMNGMGDLKDMDVNTRDSEHFSLRPPKKDSTTGNTKKPPSSNTGSNKGSQKESDPYKAETESLQEIMKLFERKIKLMEDEITLGNATVEQRQELIQSYITELEAVSGHLSKTENLEKVEEKISSLKVDQKKTLDDIGKQQEANNKLLADVEEFLQERRVKTLGSVEQETDSIQDAYAKMEQRITQSKLDEATKRQELALLDVEMQLELDRVKMENQLSLDEELNILRLQAEHDMTALEVIEINKKYDAERERILLNYEEGKKRSELLALLEHKRNEELAKAQMDILHIVSNAFAGAFNNAVTSIGDAMGSVFDSVFGEAHNLVTDFIKFFFVELVKLASSKVFKLVFDFLSGGLFSGIGGFFSSIFKADGGEVKKGRPYIVGEEGMEAFVPDEDGVILPNSVTSQLLSKSQNINGLMNSFLSNTIAEVPSVSLASIGSSGSGSSGTSSISVGDINIPIEVKKLSGLDQNDWVRLVDEELIPQISSGLKRAGMSVLDNTLNN